MTKSIALLVGLSLTGCGDDGAEPLPDAQLPSVFTGMVEQGPWTEDFIWGASAWKACSGCEHVISYDLEATGMRLHVFARTPGQPTTITEACTAFEATTEREVPGFAPSERTVLHLVIPPNGPNNTCGFGASSSDYVFQVVERNAAGAPTYIANWVEGGAPAAAFPGYDYMAGGVLATPIKVCPSAPGTVCEPACDLAAPAGCGLPQP